MLSCSFSPRLFLLFLRARREDSCAVVCRNKCVHSSHLMIWPDCNCVACTRCTRCSVQVMEFISIQIVGLSAALGGCTYGGHKDETSSCVLSVFLSVKIAPRNHTFPFAFTFPLYSSLFGAVVLMISFLARRRRLVRSRLVRSLHIRFPRLWDGDARSTDPRNIQL